MGDYYVSVDVVDDARHAVCEDCEERYSGAAPEGWALNHARRFGHSVSVMRSYSVKPAQDDAA